MEELGERVPSMDKTALQVLSGIEDTVRLPLGLIDQSMALSQPEQAQEERAPDAKSRRRSSAQKVGAPLVSASANDWRHRAACLEEDPELFFPIGDMNRGPARLQAEAAKAVCRRCEVVDTCLEWALTTGQEGVWGATTDHERRALIRRTERIARIRGQ